MAKQDNNRGPATDNIDLLDAELSKLQELGDKSQAVRISGRVYRLFAASEAVGGRPLAQFVGKVDEIVDEDYIGRHFGGGKFKLRFTVTDQKGQTEKQDIVYNIDDSYNKYLKELPTPPAPAPLPVAPVPEKENGAGNFIDKIFQKLTPDYITAFSLSIKTIKELFPPRPQPDYMELMKIIAANNNKPAFSDSVVMKAMEMQQQQQRAQSPISQLKELREIKEFFTDIKMDGLACSLKYRD